jgi:hypothetical protein
VEKGVIVLFDSCVDRVGCADLEFESLDLSVDVVLAMVRGGRFVDEVEKDKNDDEGRGEGIKHRRRVEIAG